MLNLLLKKSTILSVLLALVGGVSASRVEASSPLEEDGGSVPKTSDGVSPLADGAGVSSDIIKDLIMKIHPTVKDFHASDKTFASVNTKQVKEIWNVRDFKDFEYKFPVFDCDDFALCMKAHMLKTAYKEGNQNAFAFGVAYGVRIDPSSHEEIPHAYNIYVSTHRKLKFFEPQTGEKEQDLQNFTPNFILF